jgi:hypothetical protein
MLLTTRDDAIDDALERLRDVWFTTKPGFSVHGPMVAETISTLGHNGAVASWVDRYVARDRHMPPPPAREPIRTADRGALLAALGDYARMTDWYEFFRRELDRLTWQNVIAQWTPILIVGVTGGLTHGLIRTAHASRALSDTDKRSALKFDELARALAYWAGSYRTVAGNPDKHAELSLEEAIQTLPRVEPERRIETVRATTPEALGDLPGFATVVEGLPQVSDISDALSRHTATFARVLLSHPEAFQVPLVHTITAPSALRILLPYLPEVSLPRLYGRIWQASASLAAIYAGPLDTGLETNPEVGVPELGIEELVGRAVEHGDDHVIKLTEACLREDGIRPDPIYRVLAETLARRQPPRP